GSLTNHTHYWGYQEQQEKALRQRRGLDTAIWSLHMELCNGDTGLLPSSRFNTLVSMLAVDQCPSTCLLRGNVRFGRYTISGPPRRQAIADLSTPPRGRQRRRTSRDIEKMTGAMGPVDQRPLNAPAHSEHQRVRANPHIVSERQSEIVNLRASELRQIHIDRRPCASGSCRRLCQRRVRPNVNCNCCERIIKLHLQNVNIKLLLQIQNDGY
ncbi:unnamed protein product, partial [Trichogramma brassicae]